MIKFENVTHIYNIGTCYEKKALDDITINFAENEMIGLIGKSGSGKSTFIQHFNGLLKPTSGKISIDAKKIGLVFQYPEHQIFEMTVENEVGFAVKDSDDKTKKILEALNAVGLSETYLHKNPFELSGGEKRKVAIASILIMQPEILILDEPMVGLDAETQKNILQYIKKMHERLKMTTIIISHDMDVIAEFTQKTIIMDSGKIIFYGRTSDAFNLPNINLPMTKKLAKLLYAKKIDIPSDIISFEDTVKFLAEKIKEKSN